MILVVDEGNLATTGLDQLPNGGEWLRVPETNLAQVKLREIRTFNPAGSDRGIWVVLRHRQVLMAEMRGLNYLSRPLAFRYESRMMGIPIIRPPTLIIQINSIDLRPRIA